MSYGLAPASTQSESVSTGLIYLASPYSSADPKLPYERFRLVSMAAARLLKEGFLVFSPICHSYPIAKFGGTGHSFDEWKSLDELILSKCKAMFILELYGWEESSGIREEERIADRLGIPIYNLRRDFRSEDLEGLPGRG